VRGSPNEIVYTSAPALAKPRLLFRSMMRDLVASRELAWRLFLRDFQAQYRRTLLGYAWVVLPPLVSTAVWVLLQKQDVLQVAPTNVPYPLFVLIGMMLWDIFLSALNAPLAVVTASASMLTKINFPRESLILAGIANVAFGAIVRLAIIVAAAAYFHVPWTACVLVAPIGVAALILLGIAVGLLLVPIGVLYQDVSRSTGILYMALFLVTPVIYPPPETGIAAALVRWNPIAPLLTTTREALTTGRMTCLREFLLVVGIGVLLSLTAWFTYRVSLPHLVARLNT
jgi:lipopolysaccharide transport system permease protein